jgi:hypothetical protein
VAFSQDGDTQAPCPGGRDERVCSAEAKWRQQPLDNPLRRECPGREVGRGSAIVLTYSRRATSYKASLYLAC